MDSKQVTNIADKNAYIPKVRILGCLKPTAKMGKYRTLRYLSTNLSLTPLSAVLQKHAITASKKKRTAAFPQCCEKEK
jgi:hypothetical protein